MTDKDKFKRLTELEDTICYHCGGILPANTIQPCPECRKKFKRKIELK